MEQFKPYHCWVKVPRPPLETAGARADTAPARSAAPAAERDLEFPHRPPPTVIAASPDLLPSVSRVSGASALGFAGAPLTAWWSVDDDYDGVVDADTDSVVLASYLGTRAQAVAWIASPEGVAWRADATNYFLISFSLVSDF